MRTVLLCISWILGVHGTAARGLSECRSSRIDTERNYHGQASLTCQKSSVTVKTIFIGRSLKVDDFEVVCSGKKAIKLLHPGDKIRKKKYQRTIPIEQPENCVLFGCYYDHNNNHYQLPSKSCSYKDSYFFDYQYDSGNTGEIIDSDSPGQRMQHDESSGGSKQSGPCLALPSPKVGEVDQGVEIAIYTCPTGHSMRGLRTRTCDEGSWVPPKPPVCFKNAAAPPSTISTIIITTSILRLLLFSF